MIKISKIVFILLLFGSCKSTVEIAGTPVEVFKGMIVYDVEVIQKVDTQYQKSKKGYFGNEMTLTVFKNGDILKSYTASSPKGYAINYLSVENNEIVEKYNYSDTVFLHEAGIQNIVKLNELRGDDKSIEILGHSLKEISLGAQETNPLDHSRKYLNIKYWYTDALILDKSKYTTVNADLWNHFMNKTNGALFLKYEVDYFTYKVIYTAKEIIPNKYDKVTKKMLSEAPTTSK